MMRLKVEDIENSKLWSFATAALRVLSYPQPKGDLHARKRLFLRSVLKELYDTKKAVSEFVKWNDYQNEVMTNIQIVEIAERYRQAHEVAYHKACHIVELAAEELQRYTKDELHFDEVEDKSFQPETYTSLLLDLQTCALGVINNEYTSQAFRCTSEDARIQFFYELIGRVIKNATVLYDFAAATGGSYVPVFQGLDPLIGSTTTDVDKYDVDLGQCHGHTVSWGRQVSESGAATKLCVLDEYTFHAQLYQYNYEAQKIKSARLFAEEVLRDIGFKYIYKIGLFARKGAHSLGIRRIPGTTKIEFFDSNLGLFVLPTTTAFIEFFQLYLSTLLLNCKSKYHTYTLSTMFEQNVDVMPDCSKPVVNKAAIHIHTSFRAYVELFDLTQNKFRDKYFAGIDTTDLKRAFTDQMLVRIKCTENIEVLDKLLQILSVPLAELDKPEYEKFQFVKVLHARVNPTLDKFRFWSEESTSISVLKGALNDRINVLKLPASRSHRPHNVNGKI